MPDTTNAIPLDSSMTESRISDSIKAAANVTDAKPDSQPGVARTKKALHADDMEKTDFH